MANLRTARVLALLALSLLVLVWLTVDRLGSAGVTAELRLSGSTMGTTFSVQVPAGEVTDRSELSRAIQRELDAIDQLLSTYDPASEISRLNRHADTTAFLVSESTLSVLLMAREVAERSGGALDVTAAPLVAAWGFGADGMEARHPTEEDLRFLLAAVGYEKLDVDAETRSVRKLDPSLSVDLSAIAKGYGVDRVAELLVERGVPSFLVEVGGEIRVRGRNSDGNPWRIAIEAPQRSQRNVYGVVEMSAGALATSGDYRDFREIDGARYAHIVDPRSGRARLQKDFSVSVFAPQAMAADAWATALTALGPAAGYDLALREGVAALFVERIEEGFRSRTTSGFPSFSSSERFSFDSEPAAADEGPR